MKPKGPIKYDNFTFINEIKKPSTANNSSNSGSDTLKVQGRRNSNQIYKSSFLENSNYMYVDGEGKPVVKPSPVSTNNA